MLDRLLSLTEVTAIAHRGGSALRPENTLAAFAHAAELGADAIECDVHLSSDGEPVVIHDYTLERTTDAAGPVSDRTARELSELDAGHHFAVNGAFPFRGQGLHVPRLAEVLDRWRGPVIVEIKGERPETAERALDVIRELGARDRVIIGGFSGVVLDAVRRVAPGVPTSASRDEITAALIGTAAGQPLVRGAFTVYQAPIRYQGQNGVHEAFVRAARALQIPVQVWIVDDPEEMRQLIRWGATGIISDRPDLAVGVRDRMKLGVTS